MSKRKPDSELTTANVQEDEEENSREESGNVRTNASQEVMKTRRKTDKTSNGESTINVEAGKTSPKSNETPSSTFSFGTGLSTPPSNNFTYPTTFSFGIPSTKSSTNTPTPEANAESTTSTPSPSIDKPAFSFGLSADKPNFSFGSTTSTDKPSFSFGLGTTPSDSLFGLNTGDKQPFTFAFPTPSSFTFGTDFKFPSFTSLASFNSDADKTRAATANAAPTWSTEFNVKSESGESSTPHSPSVKLSKIENPSTGEEGETTLAEARVRLYEFEKSNWKERGVGNMKINTDKTKYRLLMRTDTTLKVILNAAIYNEMMAEEQSDKQLRFACINSVQSEDNTPEKTSDKTKISTYIVRFPTKQTYDDFYKALQTAKIAAGPLKKSTEEKPSETSTNEEEQTTEPKETEN